MNANESLRRSFRPTLLRLLFVGESPPASGRFFYRRDSGLYRAMRDAFQSVDPSIDDEHSLARFQASGCYFIDLCAEPVDHLDSKSRRAACVSSEKRLARLIAQLKPVRIATVVRSIEANVMRAALRAHWCGGFIHLPYPGRWSRYRDAFVNTLAPTISGLMPQERGRSGSLLPMGRVAAAVKTGNDEYGFVFEEKEQGVRKTAQKGAVHILKDNRELPGHGGHAPDQHIYRLPKAAT
jgi:hypothetical protein